MDRLEDLGKVVETDVLVIGAGVAGLFSAIRAKAFVDRVTLVDKGPVGKTSQCYWALGGHQALLPEDSLDDTLEQVVYFHDGLCEQDIMVHMPGGSHRIQFSNGFFATMTGPVTKICDGETTNEMFQQGF